MPLPAGALPSPLFHETLSVLLGEDLIVRVDDADGQQDAGAAADGAQEITNDCECTDAHTTKGCRSRDVSVELVDG